MSLDIGDHVVEAMIDTGSECTLIKQRTAAHMGMEVNTTKNIPPLQGVTGRSLRILGSIHTSMRVGSEVFKVMMIVVPDHYLHLPVLLGMDVMVRLTREIRKSSQAILSVPLG